MKVVSTYVAGHWESPDLRWFGAVLGLAGVVTAAAGVVSFRKARTTVNPLNPSKASQLVTSGVFKFTRNPMYLGMLMLATGWGFALSSYWSFVGVVLFALFITRFQIVPEERAMKQLFGSEFVEYSSRTSRWL